MTLNGVHPLHREDAEEFIRLSEFAFQYELSHDEREKKIADLKLDRSWGYYVEGKLAAKSVLIPFHVWLGGKKLEMGGIASVATWPEYRRRGMVGSLLQRLLEEMKRKGQTVSFLHPFSYPFYRKYGWEMLCETKKYELSVKQLPVLPEQVGRIERTEDWRLLNTIYEQYAPRYAGMLVRKEEWWKEKMLNVPGRSAVYTHPDGRPGGYIRYQIKNKEMQIHELVCLDDASRRGLWKFIANHDSMIDKLFLTAPANDHLPFLLADPRIKQETVPYFMARIVDAAAFLEQFPFAPGRKSAFILHLEDVQAEWNRGSLEVSVDADGRARVRALAGSPLEDHHREGDGPLPPGIACDIQTLSVMMMGYQRPAHLQEIGRLQANDEAVAVLEDILPRWTPYLTDYF